MDLPEFRIDMEFENMQQLDDAMKITINNKVFVWVIKQLRNPRSVGIVFCCFNKPFIVCFAVIFFITKKT